MVGKWITYFKFVVCLLVIYLFWCAIECFCFHSGCDLASFCLYGPNLFELYLNTVDTQAPSSWSVVVLQRGMCLCVFVIVCVCFEIWEITHYILACTGRHKSEILACLNPSSFSCAGNLWPLSDSSKRNERELLLSKTTTPDPFKTASLPPLVIHFWE